MPAIHTNKIYCYVDESGQETEGRLFVVAIVLTGPEHEHLLRIAEDIEETSGKRIKKWHKAPLQRRIQYINTMLNRREFRECLYFARFTNTRDYVDATVQATAEAIMLRAARRYKATIIVDALRDAEIPRFTRALRARSIQIKKVRGVRDESDALIRLADAIAGFVRDCIEELPYTKDLRQAFDALQEILAK